MRCVPKGSLLFFLCMLFQAHENQIESDAKVKRQEIELHTRLGRARLFLAINNTTIKLSARRCTGNHFVGNRFLDVLPRHPFNITDGLLTESNKAAESLFPIYLVIA